MKNTALGHCDLLLPSCHSHVTRPSINYPWGRTNNYWGLAHTPSADPKLDSHSIADVPDADRAEIISN